MSDLTNVFTDIADAIRAKTETQITYKPTEMADAINNLANEEVVYNDNGVSLTVWFNIPVKISEDVTSTYRLFSSCRSFNQPVIIPNSVINTSLMFNGCYNFNQPVTIPNSVIDTSAMFNSCPNFNQPVTIPDSVINTSQMFNNCFSLNQPVTILGRITSIAYMFFNCSNFNQPITIPDSVTNTILMFTNCYNFNQPVIIPNSATNVQQMFNNSTSFGSNIYWYTNVQKTATKNMLAKCNNSLAKHIFTNNTNAFNGTASYNSITGTSVTWTQDGDNFYNADFNIYIHNVANPYTVLNNESYYFDSRTPIPDSPAIVFGSGVRDLNLALSSVSLNSSNTLILFEEGVENLYECFAGQDYFNQPLTIPSSAVDCVYLLTTCGNFNSPVIFRNGVRNLLGTFDSCPSFDKDVWIPESVTNLQDTFYDCTAFESGSGIVHISHNIALGDTTNYIYSSLVNREIGITLDPSRILNDY